MWSDGDTAVEGGPAGRVHPLRCTAEEEVALGHVGHELGEGGRVGEVRRRGRQPGVAARHPGTFDGDVAGTLVPGQVEQLPGEDELVAAVGAVDHDDVAGVLVEPLEQGPDGGDPDPGTHEQHLAARADTRVEAAVRSFDEDPGARLHRPEPGGPVPHLSRSDPQAPAVGGCGEGVGVRAAPARSVQEAPLQELPRCHLQLLDPATGDHDRGDAGSLRDHGGDPQRRPQRTPQGDPDAVDEDRGCARGIQAPPEDRRSGGGEELLAGPQLVREG